MSHQVVKVQRNSIAACMTCPLCDKLLKDATTISECLHSFCRRCIYKKLSDEETDSCPTCNIDLGCVPLEKLRPDHNLQDVRAKIFPYRGRKVSAPEIVPWIGLPMKRKERSLSSLVVNTPKISSSSSTQLRGRRSKYGRKAQKNSTFSITKNTNNDTPSSPDDTLNKFTQSIKQNVYTGESSNKEVEKVEPKVNDLWNPLTCLVEAATHKSKTDPDPKTEGHTHVRKLKVKQNGQNIEETEKPRKYRKIRQKKEANTFAEFNISPRAVLDAANIKSDHDPVWFSLVASEDQEGDAPLPQISASFLRVRDGNVPVSLIQKYLVRKLNLTTEDEVEIRCMGRSILATWQLNHLVDLWLQSMSIDRVSTNIGSSAKDFVMVLAYARKIPTP